VVGQGATLARAVPRLVVLSIADVLIMDIAMAGDLN